MAESSLPVEESSSLLGQGIASAKRGETETARKWIMRAIELDDHNEAAWLWLSSVVDGPGDRILCLENALTINPDNRAAQLGLKKLRELHPAEPSPVGEPEVAEWTEDSRGADDVSTAPPPVEPSAGGIQGQPADDVICLRCGATVASWRDHCEACGQSVARPPVAADLASPAEYAPAAEPEEVVLVAEYDTRPQGLSTLFAAWMAALTFNGRGAYEYEIFSASVGRTVWGLVLGGVIIPLSVGTLAAALVTVSLAANPLAMITSLTATPLIFVCGGLAAGVAVVVQFYLWATLVYGVTWLLGGRASFVVHAQLLSVAYAAGSLVGGFLAGVGSLIWSVMVGPRVDQLPMNLVALVGTVLIGLMAAGYALAMYGQALAVAHRLSWPGSVGILLLTSALYGLMAILGVLVLVLVAGLNPADLQSLPFPTLFP